MIGWNEEKIEELLISLEKKEYLFPEYELYKEEGRISLLGKGGYSRVYEMYNKMNPELRYAMKVIGFEKHTVTSKQFWETVRIQRLLDKESKHVVRIIDAKELVLCFDESGNFVGGNSTSDERWSEDGFFVQFVLMEKLEETIVKDKYNTVSLTGPKMDEQDVVRFAFQIGSVLHVAHVNHILHRDIKLENIFVDEKNDCYKLGDFGISKFVEDGYAETVVYTDGYGAPEIERCFGEVYDATADIYSFGITLYLLLNNLKFPGSEGYYANMIQYDSQYIFPAPVNASPDMVRIIRKMCMYQPEDRYQSVAEVMMDLQHFAEKLNTENDLADEFIYDFATETYKETESTKKERKEKRTTGRIQRKKEEQIDNLIYNNDCVSYLIGLSILFTLFITGLEQNTQFVSDWRFWILPCAVLIEAILLRIKEFHIIFGTITIGVIIYSMCVLGITVPHILLLLSVIVSIPVLTAAGAVSVGLWVFLEMIWKVKWLDFLWKFDLAWIVLVIILAVVAKLIDLRIVYEKVTERRAIIDLIMLDVISPAFCLLGIILIVLGHFDILNIPDVINRLHLVRTGLLFFLVMLGFNWYENKYCLETDIDEDDVTDDGINVDE